MWTGGAFPVAKPRAEAPVPRCVVGARGHAIAGNVWAPDRAGAALYSCSQTARPRLRRCAMWTNLNLVINEGSLPVWALVIFVGHHTRLQLHADRHWRQLRSVTSFSLRTQSSKKTVQVLRKASAAQAPSQARALALELRELHEARVEAHGSQR